MNKPTALATIVNGEQAVTIYALALVLNVHPDDLPNTIEADDLPTELRQRAYRRGQEAKAHGAAKGIVAAATYYAQTEHNATIYTDNNGTTWMYPGL